MTTYVALLRGINVGGNKPVPMADLRAMAEKAGFTAVQSWLQSGNLVFQGKTQAPSALEKKLEQAAAKQFGQPIDFFVRDQKEWSDVLEKNPFRDEAARDPSHLLLFFLKTDPAKEALTALKSSIVGREHFEPGPRCLYVYYPDGIGRSKFTHALIEKKLGTRGTGRNWNTAQKLAGMMSAE